MLLWVMGLVVVGALVGLYFAYRYDLRQMEGRTRRHRETRERPTDPPPDWTPPIR